MKASELLRSPEFVEQLHKLLDYRTPDGKTPICSMTAEVAPTRDTIVVELGVRMTQKERLQALSEPDEDVEA